MPNIINVAVFCAKQNLYVVGSYAAWRGVGHASEFKPAGVTAVRGPRTRNQTVVGESTARREAAFVHAERLERFMIKLNSATATELDEVPQLKGHGFEIVRYREERGRFSEVRQLEEVPGLAGKWNGAETLVSIE